MVHQDAPPRRLHLVREGKGGPHHKVLLLVIREPAGDDGANRLKGVHGCGVEHVEGLVVDEPHIPVLGVFAEGGGGLHVFRRREPERSRRLLVRDAARLLPERDGADVELLDVVNRADGEGAVGGDDERVGERGGVERAHVVDGGEVDVAIKNLFVGTVDDGRAVRGGEDVRRLLAPKVSQRDGERPERKLLAARQRARGWVRDKVEEVPVPERGEQVRSAVKDAEEH
mmetsp:Transcript_12353/g.40618  ORF Transcript_12353/g.40618 Transcript_12353/m.40618 type:complete len:228 (-) Transcript_12353:1790-2473(-)